MRHTGTFVRTVIAAGAAFALLTGCAQEKKPDAAETAFDPVDPLSLPLGEKQPPKQQYNTNIPPVDELKKQYKAYEKERYKALEPKIKYAYNKLYKPYTYYPQSIKLPQPPKSEVTFARDPKNDDNQPKVVLLKTTEAPESIEKFYADKLQKDGWRCVAQKGNHAYHEVVAIKGKQQITVTIYIDVYKDQRVIRIETKPKRTAA